MRGRPRWRISIAGVMVGVGLVGLALGFARAYDAPPQVQAIVAAWITFQYLTLFVIVFYLGPKSPQG